jgi:ribosomal-protein-alanine N-acetyltransferase
MSGTSTRTCQVPQNVPEKHDRIRSGSYACPLASAPRWYDLEIVKTIVETERLLLREFVEDDAEAFFSFNGDPEVMRHTGQSPSTSVSQVRREIRDYPDYRKHGFGRWAVVYKPDQVIVGFNGLKYLDDLREVDLGYRFRVDYWGKGIATESSRAVLSYGFEELGLKRIIGLVLPANTASVRVLKKVGMRFDGMVDYCGDRAQRWILHRPDPA